jgi:hypothetical protein
MVSKLNLDNVGLQEIVRNNVERVDVNYIIFLEIILMRIITIVDILDHLLLKILMIDDP